MASNSVIHGPKLNFKNFLKVLPESGVISKPMISDICFQCRGLMPWLHNVEITGIFACEEKPSHNYILHQQSTTITTYFLHGIGQSRSIDSDTYLTTNSVNYNY